MLMMERVSRGGDRALLYLKRHYSSILVFLVLGFSYDGTSTSSPPFHSFSFSYTHVESPFTLHFDDVFTIPLLFDGE